MDKMVVNMNNIIIRTKRTEMKFPLHFINPQIIVDAINDKETIIVCHSIGNPFIIKYLSKRKLKAKLYISVAGFCKLFTVPDREDLNKAFIDFQVSKENIEYCLSKIPFRYSLYSDNDHVIPFDILKDFEEIVTFVLKHSSQIISPDIKK